MQNIKYHVMNTVAMALFSFVLATAITQFIRLTFSQPSSQHFKRKKAIVSTHKAASFEEYRSIIDSGFFRLSGSSASNGQPSSSTEIASLSLLGTVTGPASIARALIKKNNEKEARIYRLWSSVDGFKLVKIYNSRVYLKSATGIEVLDMFATQKKEPGTGKGSPPDSAGKKVSQTLSRSELQQKVLNNMDNALRGLRAGPYRVDGKIEGYKLFSVHPSSVLYRFGARNGDVVKRINGHPVESTEKLYQMWQNLKGDSRITVDLERGGQLYHYDFTIKE